LEISCMKFFPPISIPSELERARRTEMLYSSPLVTCSLTRVSTEFRRHGIPRNFLTSEVIFAKFRRNSGEIPRNSAEFRGISPELCRKSLPYSAECQNVTSVDTLSLTLNENEHHKTKIFDFNISVCQIFGYKLRRG
jgi:hypothetical protein